HPGKNHGFRFYIGKNLLDLLPVDGKINVRLGNSILSFKQGVNEFLDSKSEDSGLHLMSMLNGSWHIDHWGNLHKPFGKAPELKRKYLEFYAFWVQFFRQIEKKDLFLIGGNLLGLMRDFEF